MYPRGAAILATGWRWLDPLVSLAVAAAIVWGTWGLLRDSLDLALDAVPAGVDEAGVRAHLRALPGVADVHDLHVWGMSTTEAALTAHLVRPDPAGDAALLERATRGLHDGFGIEHVTLQLETAETARRCETTACGGPDAPARPA